MKALIQKNWFALFIVITMFSISGCLKGDFDTPPTNIPEIKDEQIITFDKMFEKLVANKVTNIQEEKYLEALVVADDKSGNLYKSLILKDMRGEKGISMSIDENEIHALYPVGQVVYVLLKDLAIGYYEGLPTLGVNSGSSVGRIPPSLLRSVIIKSGRTAAVEPLKVNFTDLNSSHINRLIELEGMQFETVTANTTYADANPDNPQSLNHNLVDCANHKIILRNSGFASFAGDKVPHGNGSIVAVYSYFRNAAQLLIRDVTDVNFTGERCGGGGGTTGDRIRIKDLRSTYIDKDIDLTAGYIQGIVISDFANKNINGQNMVIQDGDYGILLRFKAPISVPLGSEVKIGLKGGLMGPFNGLLQVQNLDNQSVEILASNKSVTPKVLTISQIDLKEHESTLVKVQDATLSGGSILSENIILTDATGNIAFFTNKAATFASQGVPTGAISVTAIVSTFNGKQLNIRNLSDIVGGGDPSGGGEGIDESFSSQAADKDINLPKWDNVNVKGNRKWQAKYYGVEQNYYAQATAFGNTGPAEMEAWLITPEFNTDKTSNFSLKTSFQNWVHDGLSVWVTTNYTGDPSTTVWQEVSGLKIATQGDPNQTWIPSGIVNLKSYGKNLRIGFKHVGSQSSNTTSYRIDEIVVE